MVIPQGIPSSWTRIPLKEWNFAGNYQLMEIVSDSQDQNAQKPLSPIIETELQNYRNPLMPNYRRQTSLGSDIIIRNNHPYANIQPQS
jgi:hypothetical protein